MTTIRVTTQDYYAHFNTDELPDDWYSADHVLRYALLLKPTELVKAYADATCMSEAEITMTYEGGIKTWIGFGSVTCFELPCTTMVGFSEDDLLVSIT
jgi:hypothetical protein